LTPTYPNFKVAICREIDPEFYFASVTQYTNENMEVKKLCNKCPSKAECLDYALETLQVGIWGGTNERERKRIRNKREREKVA
jgi:WhiB family redox-sensing transcriptional regulator